MAVILPRVTAKTQRKSGVSFDWTQVESVEQMITESSLGLLLELPFVLNP
jgi:hypothetical protein